MPDCFLFLSFFKSFESSNQNLFVFFNFLLSILLRNESSNGAAKCARLGYPEKISCDFKEQVIFSAERESWYWQETLIRCSSLE